MSNGLTIADLKISGTMPVERLVFMMSWIGGRRISIQSNRRGVGIGSRGQVVGFDKRIINTYVMLC